MAKAVGVGGIFFRARDTAALAAWYKEHFGVDDGWMTEAGMTVFAPFKETSDYFPADKQWMVNFRVDDLDALLADLSIAGIAVETRAEWDAEGVGRFARISDPEGNQIELWEPAKPPSA
jgi:predicted enzyme related to lactoylglutathione lyase